MPVVPPELRIGVLADTHDRLPQSVVDQLAGCDQIWHLGDVCEPSTLIELELLGKPLSLVRGNCDSNIDWPLSLDIKLAGKNFHLTHIPPSRAPGGTDFLLHGHTHVPRDQMVHGARFLNPGCISRPNRGATASFAYLTIPIKGMVSWNVVRV
jgi:putative phosphoesterase